MPILTKQQIAAITELCSDAVKHDHEVVDPDYTLLAKAGLENLEFTAEIAERSVKAVGICNQLLEQAMRVMKAQEAELEKLATVRTVIGAFIFLCGAAVGYTLAVTIVVIQ